MEGKAGRDKGGRTQRIYFGNIDLDGEDGSGTTEDCFNIISETTRVNEECRRLRPGYQIILGL